MGLKWIDEASYAPGQMLGENLSTPTRLYVSSLQPLIQAELVKGMVHITGGGLLDNIPRVLSDDIAVELEDWS
jgi:phosphoribosylaminoimidazole (AIR) synthetase